MAGDIGHHIEVHKGAWSQTLCLLTFTLGVLLVGHYPTLISMVEKWSSSGTYAHGFLVAPIVAVLIYHKRSQLMHYSPVLCPWALLGLVLGSLAWWFGHWASILLVQQVAFVFTLVMIILLYLGWQLFQQIRFELLYLFFMVPFGHFLIAPLQDVTAMITVWGLKLTQIPFYHEGWIIQTPRGNFEVAKACSGIRYLIASVALGILFAQYMFSTLKKKIAFVTLCIVFPILANGVRAYSIVLIAYLTHLKIAVGVDHLIYGWVFFGAIMAIVFWVGARFRDPPQTPKSIPPYSVGLDHKIKTPLWAGLSVLILIGPIWGQTYQTTVHPLPVMAFNSNLERWNGPQYTHDPWHPIFWGAHQILEGQFTPKQSHQKIDVFVAVYTHVKQGAELITEQNMVYQPRVWDLLDKQVRRFSDFPLKSVHEVIIKNHQHRRVIWHGYRIGDRWLTSPLWGKFFQGLQKWRNPSGVSMSIVMSAPYEFDPQEAQGALKQFVKENHLNDLVKVGHG